MKTISFILFILLIASTAQADITAGKLLKAFNSARTSQNYATAVGYARATWELHIFTQQVGIGGTPISMDSGESKVWPKSCIPGSVTNREFLKGWIHWAENSSDFEPDTVGSVSMINWSSMAYPCGEFY